MRFGETESRNSAPRGGAVTRRLAGNNGRILPPAENRTRRRPSRVAFRPDIEGLRAVAVISVVIFHARLGLGGGFVGVDVFFVISGFLITGLLWREVSNGGTVRLGRFYGARARRLLQPDGWWAMGWTVPGGPDDPDDFERAGDGAELAGERRLPHGAIVAHLVS